jgi:transposase
VAKKRTKRRWTREFKLQAISRMDDAVNVTALAEELGVSRELMYLWRRKYRRGGAEALPPVGRPSNSARSFEEASAPSSPALSSAEQRRIEELERKIGQQQLELDFFRAALRRVRGQQPTRGEPGDTTSSR